jgi:hypothetical protein
MNKNISFLIALSIFNFSFAQPTELENTAETTTEIEVSNAVIRSHNLTITIQPKDLNDTALFEDKAQELLNIIQSVHRTQDGSNLYNKILIFIKETQEAIIAGLNLFSSANNSNPIQVIETITETIASENTQDSQKNIATENESKELETSTKNIAISINISLEKTEDENLFNALTTKMNDLMLVINENSKSAEDVVTMLNDIILASQHLPNTNLTIKIN